MSYAKRRVVERLLTQHLLTDQPGHFELRSVLRFLDNLAHNTKHPKAIHDYLVGVLLMELFTLAELTDFLHFGMSDNH